MDLWKTLRGGHAAGGVIAVWPRLRHGARPRYRGLTLAMAIALASCAAVTTGSQAPLIDGTLFDLAAFLVARSGGNEPVIVIALDPDSLASEKFKALPRAFFGPWLAEMTNALFASDVPLIGFDILFTYSAAASLGPKYDQKLKDAIRSNLARLVAVRTLRTPLADEWNGAFYDIGSDRAAGRTEPSAVAYSDLIPDPDGVVRNFRPTLAAVDHPLPTFVGELLSRIQQPVKHEFLLRPDGALERIPGYRFADVIACAEQDPEELRRIFAGKTVIVGTNLPSEDRMRGPDRFFPPPEETVTRPTGECRLDPLGSSDSQSATVPGMYLHAAAVRAILRGEEVRLAPTLQRVPVAGFAGAMGAGIGLLLAPWWALAAAALCAVLIFTMSSGLLVVGIWQPPAIPVGCLLITMAGAYFIRFLVEERGRRRIQHAFSHYLAPAMVERLSERNEALRLGGERRVISVMFADLSGFTALSERVGPEALVEITNRYLALLVGAVEKTGGYVDKFIGDAVMALWGAPAADDRHCVNAARAALLAVAHVDAARREDEARGRPSYSVRIAVNSGPAVIGNVGSSNRYNYTAMGEMVNVAARLESVPKEYSAGIVLGPLAAERASCEFLLCELDRLQVKGKSEPITVFELICARDVATEDDLRYVSAYAAALATYRTGHLREAAAQWDALQHPRRDPSEPSPAKVMAERSRNMREAPPIWDGVWVKHSK
jgi:adenylate cyclase